MALVYGSRFFCVNQKLKSAAVARGIGIRTGRRLGSSYRLPSIRLLMGAEVRRLLASCAHRLCARQRRRHVGAGIPQVFRLVGGVDALGRDMPTGDFLDRPTRAGSMSFWCFCCSSAEVDWALIAAGFCIIMVCFSWSVIGTIRSARFFHSLMSELTIFTSSITFTL